MFRYQFSVLGELVVDRLLAGIEERAQNPSPAWPAVVREFQTIVGRAFPSEGGSTGAPWPQLAKRTQADRVRQGYPPAHPILERTGNLKRALTTGEGAFVATTATSLRYLLSEETDYFKYHQSPRPRTHLPRRAPVLFTADDKTALMHPIRLYITGRDPSTPRRVAVL